MNIYNILYFYAFLIFSNINTPPFYAQIHTQNQPHTAIPTPYTHTYNYLHLDRCHTQPHIRTQR